MFDLKNLKDIRKDYFDNQKELSKKIGVSYEAYAKYEQGISIPTLETIYNFSKYYKINIDFLLGIKEKRITTNYGNYDKRLIANNLRMLRISKNLSQRGLSIKLNITQSAIHRYENGLSNPSLKVLYQYYKIFDFSFDGLCTKKFKNNIS